LYKQLYIEDATGGLQILLDANSLYGTYPVGRKIFIKCNGLCITDYNGTMELGIKANVGGSPSVQGIPANLVSQYVVGVSLNNPVTPHVVTLAQLTTGMQDRYLGTLIQLDGYEFTDTTATYSDTSAYKSTVNLFIKTCGGGPLLTVRTSAYADFAGIKVPGGNGSIYAIYTTFGTTKQLILRNTDDVKFTGGSCNLFGQDFSYLTTADNNLDFALAGWKNIAPNSTAMYKNTVFGTSGKAVKVTAFGTSLNADTAWLITPAIALPASTSPQLSFSTSYQFALGPTTIHAFVSTNYNGSNTPNTATWTQLTNNSQIPGNTATSNSSTFSSLASTGNISLASYAGQTVYIAFKYVGSVSGGKTTNFEIDDIAISR
jgi:hypothetical protein